jgi:hypothetical protein
MKSTTHKTDEDLIVGNTNYDPEGNLVYDPIIGKLTLWIGLATALVLGIVAYLVATGVWPIAGLGQFAAAGSSVAVFTGASVGLALGGLTGALIGIGKMKKKDKRQHHPTRQEREYV